MYYVKNVWLDWKKWVVSSLWCLRLRLNPFALTYQSFITQMRNTDIPVVDRKHYFFTYGLPYMEYLEKHEYKQDLSYIASLLTQECKKM